MRWSGAQVSKLPLDSGGENVALDLDFPLQRTVELRVPVAETGVTRAIGRSRLVTVRLSGPRFSKIRRHIALNSVAVNVSGLVFIVGMLVTNSESNDQSLQFDDSPRQRINMRSPEGSIRAVRGGFGTKFMR